MIEALMLHKTLCVSTPEGWLFANPATSRPFHQEEIQKNHIRKAGVAAEMSVAAKNGAILAGKKGPVVRLRDGCRQARRTIDAES